MPFKADLPDYYNTTRSSSPEQQPTLTDIRLPPTRGPGRVRELPKSSTYNPFDPNPSSSSTCSQDPEQSQPFNDQIPSSLRTQSIPDAERGIKRVEDDYEELEDGFSPVLEVDDSQRLQQGMTPPRTTCHTLAVNYLSPTAEVFDPNPSSSSTYSQDPEQSQPLINDQIPSSLRSQSMPDAERGIKGVEDDYEEFEDGFSPLAILEVDDSQRLQQGMTPPRTTCHSLAVNHPSPTAELPPIPTWRVIPESPDHDWTGSLEITSQAVNIFKIPSSATAAASDDDDHEAEDLAASVLESMCKEVGKEARTGAEKKMTEVERGGSVDLEEEEVEEGIVEASVECPAGLLDDNSQEEGISSSAAYTHPQPAPRQVLKRKRSSSESSEVSNYELPKVDFGLAMLRKRQRSLSPLARIQQLPSGRRIIQSTMTKPTTVASDKVQVCRDLPSLSRAATPIEADQAFIQSATDTPRSSDGLSRSSSPLSDPPEYIDGMSSPVLGFRIFRREGDSLRWSKWDKEGFGDREKPNTVDIKSFIYNKKSAYPPGISRNYLGSRVGRSDYPSIPVSVAKQLLAFQDERSQDIYNNFIRDVTSHLIVSCVEKKTTNPEAWKAVMLKITRSKHLPPSVRRELIDGPMDEETGELLWSQGRRCYWHSIDTIAQQQAKTIRQSLKLGRDQAIALSGRDIRWR